MKLFKPLMESIKKVVKREPDGDDLENKNQENFARNKLVEKDDGGKLLRDDYDLAPEVERHRRCDDDDPDAIVEKLNRHHFVVNVGGKVCIANLSFDPQMNRMDLTLSSVSDFKLRYGNQFLDEETTYAQLWLKSPKRRQYDGIVFLPGQEVEGFFNLFQGFPIKPDPGNCELFWRHVRNNICNGDDTHYEYVRRWMAHAIQRPQELPGTALVLRGLQGTGKGVFVENFGALFGIHYVSVYRLDQVTGRFNSHLKNVLLLHANEATCRGDKVGEGVLKGLITDPFTPVEHKGRDIINIRNYKRIIVATNEDWAVPVGMDDRRYLVLDVSSKQKENKAYFQAIAEQMANGGLEALMFDLLNEDLAGFDVRTVPFSASNFSQKLLSATPIVQWFYDALCDSCVYQGNPGLVKLGWQQEPSHQQLYTAYATWCRDSRLPIQSKPVFGRSFRKLLPGVVVGEKRRKISQVEYEWADKAGRERCYVLPSLEKCREAFQRFSKSGPEIWPEADAEE